MCEVENPKMNLKMKKDIYEDALLMELKKQIKEYNLDKHRIEILIINIIGNWKYISFFEDMPLPKPEQVQLSYSGENGKYQFKLEISAYNRNGEETYYEREFFCDKEDVLLDAVIEYLKDDGILLVTPSFIVNNLKTRYKTHTITEIESNFPDENDEDIPLFDTDECPVCMETFNENENKLKRRTFCGHPICYECFDTIIKCSKKECPLCRADYEEWDLEVETYTTEVDEDEIREIQEENEVNTLLRMVNIDDLAVSIVSTDGYDGLLGLDLENWDDGLYIFASFKH